MFMMQAYMKGIVYAAVLAAALYVIPTVAPHQSGVAVAQEKKEDSKAPMKGRKTQALGKQVYTIITEANEKVDAEDYAGARTLVDKAKGLPKLTPYETAQIYSFSGFLNFNQERYTAALRDYGKVLEQPDLPEGLQQQTLKTMSQLYFATENYNKAKEFARKFMDVAGEDRKLCKVMFRGGPNFIIVAISGKITFFRASCVNTDFESSLIGPLQKAVLA